MSKFLTIIRTDVPLEIDWDSLARAELDTEKVAAVCAKYELNQLARRLLGSSTPRALVPSQAANASTSQSLNFSTLKDWPHEYKLVRTEAEARDLAWTLEAAPKFAFDTETTGTDARTVDLVGMSFATEPGKAWYVAVPPHFGRAAQANQTDDLFALAAAQDAAKPEAREAAKRFVQIFARAFADPSKTLIPSRKPELTITPVAQSVKASFSTLPPFTTSMMGRPNFLANSQSRVSCPGTAMMAPVP